MSSSRNRLASLLVATFMILATAASANVLNFTSTGLDENAPEVQSPAPTSTLTLDMPDATVDIEGVTDVELPPIASDFRTGHDMRLLSSGATPCVPRVPEPATLLLLGGGLLGGLVARRRR